MTEEYKKLLEELNATPYGVALKHLLNQKYTELDSARNSTSWDDTLGRRRALDILDDIFKFMKPRKDVSGKTRYD